MMKLFNPAVQGCLINVFSSHPENLIFLFNQHDWELPDLKRLFSVVLSRRSGIVVRHNWLIMSWSHVAFTETRWKNSCHLQP